jgi:pilus assembly protein CpaB
MNRRLTVILVVAFAIAAFCTFLVAGMVRGRMTAARPVAVTNVIAANADIKLGTLLTANDLTIIGLTGAIPPGAIVDRDKNKAIGRGVIANIYKGEPILDSRLAPIGSGGGLAAAIPPGMRACAVRVDDVVGVSGFVTPGMHVDVLISGMPPGVNDPREGTESRTLLQDIEVLSAGQDIEQEKEGKAKPVQVVNLLVTPEQAETLSLASNQVKIQLVLRNPLDTKVEPVPGTAAINLFAGPKAVVDKPKHVSAPKKAAPAAFSIEVINGSKQSEEKFASPGGHQ